MPPDEIHTEAVEREVIDADSQITDIRAKSREKVENTLDDLFKSGEEALEAALAGEEPEAEVEEEVQEPEAEVEVEEPEAEVEEVEAEVEQPEEEVEEEVEQPEAEEPGEVTLRMGEEEYVFDSADAETQAGLKAVQQRLDEAEVLREQQDQVQQDGFKNEEERGKLNHLFNQMAADPADFLMSQVGDEYREGVALDMLLDDSTYEFITEKLEAWTVDPAERRVAAADRRAERTENRLTAQKQLEDTERAQASAREIVTEVKGLIPEGADVQLVQAFYHDALEDLKRYAAEHGVLSTDQVKEVIKPRLDLYGFSDTPKIGLVAKTAGEAAGVVEEATEAGKRLVARRQKKLAAATAPGGAGSAPAMRRPPKGSGLTEALDWADANIKTG